MTRKVDEMGRVTIPKTVLKQLKIGFGDKLELYLEDEDAIILKKSRKQPKTPKPKTLKAGN